MAVEGGTMQVAALLALGLAAEDHESLQLSSAAAAAVLLTALISGSSPNDLRHE